jgi:hypothetical protein
VSSVSAVVSNASQPLAISAISSPELNSGKSTPVPPIDDPSERRHVEDREEGMSCMTLVTGVGLWLVVCMCGGEYGEGGNCFDLQVDLCDLVELSGIK